MINRRYVRFPAGRGLLLCQWCVKIQRSAPVALLFQCWSRIMTPPHYWGFLWGLCWFSRNMNLLTRSGPEGSSHSRGIVCRDVAGKAPTHFSCTRLCDYPVPDSEPPCLNRRYLLIFIRRILFIYSWFNVISVRANRSIQQITSGKRIQQYV